MLSRNFVRVLAVCILVVLAVTAAQAAVKLPAVIGDDMVLQRSQPVRSGVGPTKVKRLP